MCGGEGQKQAEGEKERIETEDRSNGIVSHMHRQEAQETAAAHERKERGSRSRKEREIEERNGGSSSTGLSPERE